MPSSYSRRHFGRAAALVVAAGLGAPAVAAGATRDVSKEVVDSTIARNPDPKTLGGWGYTQGLFLYGTYLVYKRLHNPDYLAYLKKWVDYHVDANGHIANSFNSVDSMQSGNLLLILHDETGDPRYRAAADQIRQRVTTYPRTADGAMWHATSRPQELWCDGVFMAQPFIARYGKAFGDQTYCFDQAVHNLTTYFGHLKASNGLLFHAYSADGKAPWGPDPVTHTSSQFWARAIGWTAMAHLHVIDVLPWWDYRRWVLIENVRQLAHAFARFQDPVTGRWFQIVDKGDDPRNWTETSASAMYTYTIARAVRGGWVGPWLEPVARKGYRGVLDKVTVGADGLTSIADICEGTNVGTLDYYYARKRNVNDLHGLGSFLIMNEELARC